MGDSHLHRRPTADEIGVLQVGVHDLGVELPDRSLHPRPTARIPAGTKVEGPHRDVEGRQRLGIVMVAEGHEAHDAQGDACFRRQPGGIDDELLRTAGPELMDDMAHAHDALHHASSIDHPIPSAPGCRR